MLFTSKIKQIKWSTKYLSYLIITVSYRYRPSIGIMMVIIYIIYYYYTLNAYDRKLKEKYYIINWCYKWSRNQPCLGSLKIYNRHPNGSCLPTWSGLCLVNAFNNGSTIHVPWGDPIFHVLAPLQPGALLWHYQGDIIINSQYTF